METLDLLWHLGNLFLPAFGLGVIAAVLAKLAWWRDLRGVGWTRLALPAVAASAAALLAGFFAFGRDGKMATYVGMVVACTITLWWQGFGPGRR